MRFSFFQIVFLLISLRVHAQEIIMLDRGDGLRTISPKAEYFIDTSAALTIDDVSGNTYRSRFTTVEKQQLTIGVTRSVCWVHLKLVADGEDWCLQSQPALCDDVRLYKKVGDKWDVSLNGFNYKAEQRELVSSYLLFPLNQRAGDTVEYYLRIESKMPIFILLRAGTAKDFWFSQVKDNLFNGIFFGIMLLMALYNLFLFLTNRDRVYIYYAMYVIFCAIFISFATGYAIYLPDIFRKVQSFNHIMFPWLFGLFGLLFTMRFLFTRKYAPRMHKVMIAFAVVVFLVLIVDFFNSYLATTLIQLMGVLLTFISFGVGITVYRAGYKPARYFLLGFGIYTLGLSTYILLAVAKIDTSEISPSNIMMACSAIEAIILSFAIGDKLNAAMRDKQAAQEANMEALRQNEQLVREQNVVLEQKVTERTKEINEQKEIIEEKNKDILDSIQYAKRIQGALMASNALLKNNLPEFFIFYKPKDIVSGDFYFGAEEDGKFWLCVGDCTGHGVPGAFMSLLNISILRELISDQKILRPDQVLNKQREAIVMALNPDGAAEAAKDGMDCALLCFDKQTNHLSFSCANNPLLILREGKLLEYRPDKQPVGLHEGTISPFTLQEVQLQKNDLVIALTDGFSDQFGGPRGKKFKYSQLKDNLVQLQNKSLSEVETGLDEIFTQWKGDLEQVDDVLIIGIKIV